MFTKSKKSFQIVIVLLPIVFTLGCATDQEYANRETAARQAASTASKAYAECMTETLFKLPPDVLAKSVSSQMVHDAHKACDVSADSMRKAYVHFAAVMASTTASSEKATQFGLGQAERQMAELQVQIAELIDSARNGK